MAETMKIIVFFDGETWACIDGAQVWEITQGAYESLGDGYTPKEIE